MYVCTWFNKSINQNVIRCNPLFIVVYPCCGFLWTGHIIRRIDPSLVTTKTFLESNSPNFFFFIVPYSMCAGILEPVWFTVHRIRSKNVNSCLVRLYSLGFIFVSRRCGVSIVTQDFWPTAKLFLLRFMSVSHPQPAALHWGVVGGGPPSILRF